MSPHRIPPSSPRRAPALVAGCAVLAVLLLGSGVGTSAATTATPARPGTAPTSAAAAAHATQADDGRGDVRSRLRTAASLLEDEEFGEALELLDPIVEKHPQSATAHLYRGIALGNLGEELDAQRALLVAAGLRPGVGETHRLVAMASFRIGEYETAWEQAILADRVGVDMSTGFEHLAQVTDIPSDLEERLQAPLVYVEGADVTPLLSARQSGFEERVGGHDSPKSGRTAPGEGEDLSAPGYLPYSVTSDSPGGGMTSAADTRDSPADKLRANLEQLDEMMRRFRDAVAHASGMGITARPDAASFRLRVEIHDLEGRMPGRLVGCELLPSDTSTTGLADSDVDTHVYDAAHPKSLRGVAVLLDGSENEVFRLPFRMKNLESLADMHQRIGRYVEELESWIQTRNDVADR